MEKKNSQIFNLPKTLDNEIKMFCELNKIEDIDSFIMNCLKGGFAIEKFGITPIKAGKEVVEKEVIKEVEKIVEVIKEVPVEKIVNVIKEVPVEKIIEKEVYVTDDIEINELSQKKRQLEKDIDIKNKEIVKAQNNNLLLKGKIKTLEAIIKESPKEVIKEDKTKIISLQNEIKTLKDKIEECEDVLNHFSRFSGSKATHLKSSRLNDDLYKD
jgi:hypothetical protein